jgi:hypothetical protein
LVVFAPKNLVFFVEISHNIIDYLGHKYAFYMCAPWWCVP